MSDKADGRIAMLKPVRALFCNVLNARKFVKNGKEVGDAKHDATFVLDADDIKALKDKAIEVAKAKWPGRDLKELKFPFTKAETAAEKAKAKGKDASIYTAGTFLISGRSKYPPQLSVLEGKKVVEFNEQNRGLAKSKFYNGCYVVPQFNFVPYTGDDKDGVTAYLDALLWIKDGPKIGGVSASEAFKGYVGSVSGEDPTGGSASELDDDIPF